MSTDTDLRQDRTRTPAETRLEMRALCETREMPFFRESPPLPPSPSPDVARGYERVKYAIDFVLALGLAVVFLPVIVLAAALVRLTSRGPAFYSQTRVGKGGREFTIYKLRSMYQDCERFSGATWSPENDPRVTPLGRVLRKTHLDELPQLLNVLRGEMSLVGPRPERPEFVPGLGQKIPHYLDRLAVRPGVTGLAQIYLPPDTDVESVERKLIYDRYYLRHMGVWLDLRLILCTSLKMFRLPLRTAARLLCIPGPEKVEAVQGTSVAPVPVGGVQSAS